MSQKVLPIKIGGSKLPNHIASCKFYNDANQEYTYIVNIWVKLLEGPY